MNEFLINLTIFSLLHGSALLSSTAEDEGIQERNPKTIIKLLQYPRKYQYV